MTPDDLEPAATAPRRSALRRRTPWLGLAAVVLAGAGGSAALALRAGSVMNAVAGQRAPASPSPRLEAPRVTVTPAHGAVRVRLDVPVVVTAARGRLTDVRVQPVGAARLLPGRLSADGTRWTAALTLAPATTYRVTTVAEGPGGGTRGEQSFRTLKPRAVLSTDVFPWGDMTVGVGSPIVVRLSTPVSDRGAVERRLRVVSTHRLVGAWHWFRPTELHYRPRSYWPAGERVRLHVDFAGLDAGKGVWGAKTRDVTFRVGAAHVSVVNAARHVMTVRSNGEVIRSFPVSTGRDRYPTHGGVHIVLDKMPVRTMDSATVGIPRNSPDGYYETVYWDTRISNSGEFVHAAPWSVGSQGRANVSHGCVNASTANARWFYGFSRLGDIVSVTMSGTAPRLGDAGTADWNLSWAAWLRGSALRAPAPTTAA